MTAIFDFASHAGLETFAAQKLDPKKTVFQHVLFHVG